MSYDATDYLAYSVTHRAKAPGNLVFTAVVLRPLGAAVPPAHSKEVLAAASDEARRIGEFGQGRKVAVSLDAGPGLPPGGLHVDLVVATCEPAGMPESGLGAADGGTQITIDQRPVRVLEKCHILPYDDAKPQNPNLTHDVYLRPHLLERCGPLHTGFEFAFKGCRFRVIATLPPCGEPGDFHCGRDTVIFADGPPIKRAILTRGLVLPFFQSLPPGRADDEGRRAAAVRGHFEQRSAPVGVRDEFVTAGGLRFRVMSCQPSSGGIMPSTQLSCEGPALMSCGVCGSMAVRRCEAFECGRLLCTPHTREGVTQDGAKIKLCPEHAGSGGGTCTVQ